MSAKQVNQLSTKIMEECAAMYKCQIGVLIGVISFVVMLFVPEIPLRDSHETPPAAQ